MKKTAFMFPGQGSQIVGMGKDLYEEFDFIREIFDMTDEIAKANISKLCFNGPMEELTETVNLQPAVTAVNLACLAAIEKEGIKPNVSAGHSLGEYCALSASGILSREDTARAVFNRGSLMHAESTKFKGAMAAIIGLNVDAVSEIVKKAALESGGVVSVANHNMETQIVITGSPDAVQKASDLASEQGVRVIPLMVSGAWHSELIRGAEIPFTEVLNRITFNEKAKSVIFNVTADYITDPDEIRATMIKQLCSPVRWYDTICRLIDEEVEIFVEAGPGKVLAGLLKKIAPKDYPYKCFNVNNLKTLEKFLTGIA
ncbi:MAG: ACP S-malonyltransferase [Desulfobacterales bacterium]|nr:ACP S-malonyltransferase [Desulfobacterales bacterium]